jgi:hypothetical protein
VIPKRFRNPYIEEEQTTQWPKEKQYLYKPYINLFDTKASFDKFDCQEYGLHYIPLFAEKMYPSNDAEKKYDLSYKFGSRPERLKCSGSKPFLIGMRNIKNRLT